MSFEVCLGDTHCRVLQAPRRLLSLPLPEDVKPPVEADVVLRTAERVGDLLGIEALTPKVLRMGPGQWMLVFFHGQVRQHRAATYEDGQPGMVTYTPRQVAMVVIDQPHHLFYVSASKKHQVPALLPALNGTLFPGRAMAEPFLSYCFDLDVLPALRPSDRHPMAGTYPWRNLTLKSISHVEPGSNAAVTKTDWVMDGFELLEQQGFVWPRHLMDAGLQFEPIGADRGFTASFFQGQGIVRTALSARTLSSVAGLVQLCSHQGRATQVVEVL